MTVIVRAYPYQLTVSGEHESRDFQCVVTKGQLRKLNALCRSLGRAIADEAFSRWLDQETSVPEVDENAEVVRDALWSLIRDGRLSSRRGGYGVRRGRGRVIVEPVGE